MLYCFYAYFHWLCSAGLWCRRFCPKDSVGIQKIWCIFRFDSNNARGPRYHATEFIIGPSTADRCLEVHIVPPSHLPRLRPLVRDPCNHCSSIAVHFYGSVNLNVGSRTFVTDAYVQVTLLVTFSSIVTILDAECKFVLNVCLSACLCYEMSVSGRVDLRENISKRAPNVRPKSTKRTYGKSIIHAPLLCTN